MSLKFGVPKLFAVLDTVATPIELGVVQDLNLDISRDIKELGGQLAYAVAVGKGAGKCGGSVSLARFNSYLFRLALGGTVSSGGLIGNEEIITVPATPFEIIPAHTIVDDLGATLAGSKEQNNIQMKKVATPVNSGEYNFVTTTGGGKYVFSSADEGKEVLINYTYEELTAETVTITNELMGKIETAQLWFAAEYDGKKQLFKFPNVVFGKFSLPFKRDDFGIASLDFTCFPSGAGTLATISEK